MVFGFFLPVMVRINETLGRTVGQLPGAVLVHAVGGLFGLAFVLPFLGGAWAGRLAVVPWWGYLGGVFGIGMVVLANLAVAQLGNATFVAVNVAMQLLAGALMDQFGLAGSPVSPVSGARLLGLVLVAAGATLVARG